jgi:hypothetical protein
MIKGVSTREVWDLSPLERQVAWEIFNNWFARRCRERILSWPEERIALIRARAREKQASQSDATLTSSEANRSNG